MRKGRGKGLGLAYPRGDGGKGGGNKPGVSRLEDSRRVHDPLARLILGQRPPLGIVQRVGAPLGTVQRAGVPLGTVQRAGVPLGTVQRAGIPLSTVQRAGVPLGTVQRAGVPLGTVQRAGVPVSTVQRAGAPLGTLPARVAEGCQVCASREVHIGKAPSDAKVGPLLKPDLIGWCV
eukprot:scaffold11165_cov102-Isochrysis_galbana.AAC.1